MDKKEFNRRVMIRLVGRPLTVGSLVLTSAAGMWALMANHPLAPLCVAGVALMTCIGSFGFNLMCKTDEVAREVNEAMRVEMEQKVQQDLDGLLRRLTQDSDPRDERMLEDLRQLLSRFRGDQSWMKEMNAITVHEMTSAAEDLFRACVAKLSRSVDLRDQARTLSPEVGRGLRQAREALLDEVGQGVRGLGELYALVERTSVHRMAGKSAVSSGDIAEVLDRFKSILEIDQRVEERMNREFGSDPRDRERA